MANIFGTKTGEDMADNVTEIKRGPGRPPRERMTLYKFRYRTRLEVKDGFIEARNQDTAYELAQAWCKDKGMRFVHVEDAILLREDD